MTTYPEPSRADLVAFAQEVWRLTNEREEAQGRAPNEYRLTRIARSRRDTAAPLWVIDFLYTYDLAGHRRTVYGYYILELGYQGNLQFVRWDEMKEEE